MIPLSIPDLSKLEAQYVQECLASGWVSSAGPWVRRFETVFAKAVGASDAVAVSSGTAALHLALLVAGVQPGDLVLAPTLTFIATINSILYVGAQPVFFGCDENLNLDGKSVQRFLDEECESRAVGVFHRGTGKRVAAIIPVHVFGIPANLSPWLERARAGGIAVIEDATESLGSRYTDPSVSTGLVGDFGCFSFNGNKVITTGSGGMVVARDPDVLRKVRYLSTQAKDDELFFVHDEVGYNYRLSSLSAALGIAQLERLPEILANKIATHRHYSESLRGHAIGEMMEAPSDVVSNFWLNGFRFNPQFGLDLRAIIESFRHAGIEVRPVWKLNHLQKPFSTFLRYGVESAESLYPRLLCLPSSSGISASERTQVIEHLRSLV